MIKIPKWVNGIFIGMLFFFTIFFFAKENYIIGIMDLCLLILNVVSLVTKE